MGRAIKGGLSMGSSAGLGSSSVGKRISMPGSLRIIRSTGKARSGIRVGTIILGSSSLSISMERV